jgi:RNA polymerase sigma-70 factor (ECF subfamily)
VRLTDQDRSLWSRELIDEGHLLVRGCLRRNLPGPYQIQAAIGAVHADARSAGTTDWAQIVQLYDQLMTFMPTPIVALNRAIAVAELDGPAAGLTLVDELDLGDYHLFHATRAGLLERLGRLADADAAYDRALGLVTNASERSHLEARRRSLRH